MEIFNDQLNIGSNKEIIPYLYNGESILLSCKVSKQNHYGVWQKRNLLLTDHRLVNLKENDIRRSISIEKIMALTKNI